MKKSKKYWSEIAGYLTGEMDDLQMNAFQKKVSADKDLNIDYTLMRKTWNEFNSNPDEKYRDSTKAWKSLSNRISNEGIAEPSISSGMSGIQYVLRVAAVVLLILAVGIPTVYFSVNEFGMDSAVIEHKSNNGTLTVDLPDGSRVFLNEGAKLEYNKTYEEKRDVKLNGEGYFDVMSDPHRPFRVNAGKVVVTVLGTSFNIKEKKNNAVEVYVESGRVRVDLEKEHESLVLNPGQLVEANARILSTELKNENYLSWKTKDFKFVDESINKIIETLEQAYHVEVKAKNVSLSDMRLTTSYSDQSFDAILSTICTAMNMNYEKEGKVYILQSN